MKKILFIPTFLLIITVAFSSCRGKNVKPYMETHFALGTVCSITLYEENANFSFSEAFDLIDKIEAKMSPEINGSEIDDINSNAGIQSVVVSDETYYVIKEGIRYAELSQSKFDISIGPLVNLWGIGREYQDVPEPAEIEAVIPLIGSEFIITDDSSNSVYLEKKGMALDLGGIAKGYTADLLRDFLKEKGFKRGIINLGGNVLTFGTKQSGDLWRVGVQDPANSRGNFIGTIELKEASVVTSGIYERFFEKDGKRYHHILDPDTGYPIDNELLSISIVTKEGIAADALSTVVFSEGLQKGLELLESMQDTEGIFITKENKIHTSSGLKKSFHLISSEFSMADLQ